MNFHKKFAAVTAAFAFMTNPLSFATALVYEGFANYGLEGANLNGKQIASTGLSGIYSANSGGTICYTLQGLSFSDMPVTGGAIKQNGGYASTLTASLATGVAAPVGPLFCSYLFKITGAFNPVSCAALLAVNSGGTASVNRYFNTVVVQGSGAFPSVTAASSGVGYKKDRANATYKSWSTAPNSSLLPGSSYLVIARFTNTGTVLSATTTGSSTMWILSESQYNYLKADGITETELDAALIGSGMNNVTAKIDDLSPATSGKFTFSSTTSDVVQLALNASSDNATYTMDELRFGTTLVDVTPVTPPDPSVVFVDSFDNGFPTDSNTAIGSWTLTTPQTSTAVEGSGVLVQTASAADASTVFTTAATATGARFNFFDRQLNFGATVTMGPSNATDTTNRRGRFVLSSSANSGFASPDTFSVLFMVENAIKLDTKTDYPNVDPNTTSAYISPKIVTTSGGIASFPYYNYTHKFNLTVNAKRYRLVSNVTADGGLRARFSGEHGINRSKWGANGDSSILLEAVRTGAAAGTASIATWDNLSVDVNSDPLLNEPFWEMNVSYPIGSGTGNTDFRLWVPSTEPVIRGMIFVGPGDGLDYRNFAMDPMVQEAARTLGFGVLAYKAGDFSTALYSTSNVAQNAIQKVLDQAATVSGHPELTNAPICITGFSRGAANSVHMAMKWPERTIAYVANHYGDLAPTTPSDATLKVPGLFIAGSLDWTLAYVQSFFTSWRQKGAQVAFNVDTGVDHALTGNQGWESTWTWLVETANLRYPRPLCPSTTPGQIPSLINLADESGWLGENLTITYTTATPIIPNPFITIAPYSDYKGTISSASWYPNETCARVYRALTSVDSKSMDPVAPRTQIPKQLPLRITSPAQYADQIPVGTTVPIVVDPREFDDVNAIAFMEFYDGSVLLGTITSGSTWSLSYMPTASGLHSLTVVATDTAGNKSTALRTLFVAPTSYPPLALQQSQTTEANAEVSGTLSAKDPVGGTVVFTKDQEPSHGLLVLDSNTGTYTYRPVWGFSGTDGFTFTAQSGTTSSQSTSVIFNINSPASSDASGIPTAWVTTYGISDPYGDEDGDGISNLGEYLSNTNPLDPTDYFHIQSMGTANPSAFSLVWSAKGGVRYRVQYSDDLQSFTDIIRSSGLEIQPGEYGTPGEASFMDDETLTPAPASGKRFYRIRTCD